MKTDKGRNQMEPVSKAKADKVLKAVEKKFAAWIDPSDGPDNKPTLFPDWAGDGHWAIVWEGGSPYEWALTPIGDPYHDEEFGGTAAGVPMPAGVFTEPYYSFVLMIYPAFQPDR
jgi:hypothetical protein